MCGRVIITGIMVIIKAVFVGVRIVIVWENFVLTNQLFVRAGGVARKTPAAIILIIFSSYIVTKHKTDVFKAVY